MMAIPEWEIDSDGYPTEESEAAWAALEPTALSHGEAVHFLRDIFPSIMERIPCCGVTVDDGTDVCEQPVKKIYFWTGGWSGAETVIDAILNQFWIRYHYTQWKRGGGYWFEVPAPQANVSERLPNPLPQA